MKSMERKIVYTVKQYERKGFGHTYYFVDAYKNMRLMQSVMIDKPLADDELERFLNVFISRLHKGNDVCFFDSTERRMNEFFEKNQYKLSALESTLASKMGKDHFEVHYEKKCYYLIYIPKDCDREVLEIFYISESYSPLMCLKMAHQLGQTQGTSCRILLSDRSTEVDPELLAFAINEN